MKSPFPGMDPYLERWWRDVHHSLCTYARDQLQTQLGSGLRARIDERLVVEEGDERHNIFPDVRVIERKPAGKAPVAAHEGVALAEPLVVHIDTDPAPQGFIEIVDVRDGGRVVTIVEFLSPSNKVPGDGQEQYLRKQRECRDARVNLVEIGLTRTGRRITLA